MTEEQQTLWLLKPDKSRSFGIIVQAQTESEAREFAANSSGADRNLNWTDPGEVHCEMLTVGAVRRDLKLRDDGL